MYNCHLLLTIHQAYGFFFIFDPSPLYMSLTPYDTAKLLEMLNLSYSKRLLNVAANKKYTAGYKFNFTRHNNPYY